MIRRLTLPIVLLLTMIVSGVEAWRTDRDAAATLLASGVEGPVVATPLASVRRAPAWLQRPVADAALDTALDAVIAASPPDTCLVVRDAGRVVYQHNADLPLTPASTVKLLTATASLTVLGADRTLDTTAVAAAAPQGGVLAGNLWLVGGGDPILSTKDYVDRFGQAQPFTDVAQLADRIVAAGVKEIRGDIVGDESRYDTRRSVATWDPSFLASREAGPLSALIANDGLAVWPKSKFNTPSTPSSDPAQLTASIVRDLLVQRGVRVTGAARSGKAPTPTVEVAKVSGTVVDAVSEMLAQSDNTTAELLTKEIGVRTVGEGSTAAGVAAARDALTKAGLPTAGVSVVDGSGLDRSNTLTCAFLVALLDRNGPTSPVAKALPVAGKSGTLAERFLNTIATGRIRAKTGSLRNSRALAGFADAGKGTDVHTLTFAYIANQTNLNTDANLKVQDQLGVGLASYPQAPTLSELGPR